MSPSTPRRRGRGDETAALYVRLPAEQAGRLDRAAFELGVPKRQLIVGLVDRYVDPARLESLAGIAGEQRPRRFTVELDDPGDMVVGHHSFRAREGEVLTLADAAELLQVEQELVGQLAEAGELPGRKLGEQWRFSRQALIDWLARV